MVQSVRLPRMAGQKPGSRLALAMLLRCGTPPAKSEWHKSGVALCGRPGAVDLASCNVASCHHRRRHTRVMMRRGVSARHDGGMPAVGASSGERGVSEMREPGLRTSHVRHGTAGLIWARAKGG